ncbi:MAG: hypothetical protein HY744_26615, partial [Deltaproteobacteria bacterium]|nr:hypothetical protein [Deltaproteobacteria bacterium]
MTERGTVGAALVLLATSIAAPARGQDGEQGPAAGGVPAQTVERAAALFERGLADMLAKRFASGCPTLAASYRTNPLPGTLFTLAECYAYWKRPATAMPLYRDFLSRVASMEPKQQDKQAERVQVARSQLAALEGRVAWLTISPASELPDGSVVLLDGIPVAPSLLGEPLAVDPGRRRVRA